MSTGKAAAPARQRVSSGEGFPHGNSMMAGMIREFDWSGSLGPIDTWPQTLRTSVSIVLESPVPIVMLWGTDGIMLYNDAYSEFAGKRHPTLLGSKVLEGWPEVADFNRNVMEQCLQGKTLSYKDQQLTLHRNGRPEQVWMNLNYSPIVDETGVPAGVIAIVVETSRRIRAEAALQAEQKRLHDLFMHAPAMVAVLRGPDHIFELANPLYLQAVGNRQVVGKPILQALPELEGQGICEILDGVYASGTAAHGDEVPVKLYATSGIGDDIRQCYFNFVYQPYLSDDGRVEGILVHAVDITDQVAARKEVEEQNRVLEMIANGASLGDTLDFLLRSIEKQSTSGMLGSVLILDDSGQHLRHGAAPSLPDAYNHTIDGLKIGPAVGSCGTAAYTKKPVIVSDTGSDPLWAKFANLAAKYNLRSCWSTPIMSADNQVLGTFAMYYKQVHTPTDEDRDIIRFVTRTAALIIERKKAETALLASEKRFRFMAETLPLKIFTANADGAITYFSPQWAEYTGKSLEDLSRTGVQDFMHPDDVREKMDYWNDALKHGRPMQNEQRLRRFDGQYRRHVSFVRPMRNDAGTITGWFGSVTDIEDVLQTAVQKEKLEMVAAGLKEQRAQLLAINKTKDEFISLSSHQLRTPATAVKQYISLVLDGYFGDVPAEQRQSLQTAYDSNERQLSIINDLLKTAQLDSQRYSLHKLPVVLAGMLQEAIAELQASFDLKRQTVDFDGADDTISTTLDRGEMTLALINLLENASKYSYPDTTIRVRLRKQDGNAYIDISDAGVGIAETDLKRIFDKFTRIDNELSDTVSGSGLGLYWVRKIVKLHKGTISVRSAVGEGTTFSIRLPLV